MNTQISNHDSLMARRACISGTALVLALLSSSSLLACGGGGSSPAFAGSGGEGGAEEVTSSKSGSAGKADTTEAGGEGGSPIVNCDERPTESVELNQPFWQTGFKVTLGTATLKPQTASCSPGVLTVDAQFENRGTETQTFDARTLLSSAGKDYELPYGQDLPNVPGGRLGKGSFAFNVDDTFSLSDAVLSFGGADRHQAKVPFGKDSPDPLITLEPQVLPIKGKVVAGYLTINFEDALALGDAPGNYQSLPANEVRLILHYNAMVTAELTAGDEIEDEAFVLTLPDATSIAPVAASFKVLRQKNVTEKELWVAFSLPAPAAGKYSLEIHEINASDPNLTVRTKATFPFTLPSFPAFGDK